MLEYKQIISSTKTIFYDMVGKEVEVDLPEYAWNELNEAIYQWEQEQV